MIGPGELASTIEHTLLRSDATPAQIEKLCREAAEQDFHGVCVNPIFVSLAEGLLQGTHLGIVTVVAFPLGASTVRVAAHEAEDAVDHGATEIDLVVPVGLALAGELDKVGRAVRTVREAVPGAQLKVILETGYFTPAQLIELCQRVLEAGVDFLKTSTGFGPRGASVDDVKLLVECAAGRAGVKAAGGIRSAGQARALLVAGASRLGTSSGVQIVAEAQQESATGL